MPLTRGRAIVFRNVNMNDLIPATSHRSRQVLFFDVRVERVIHHLEIGMIGFATEPGIVSSVG